MGWRGNRVKKMQRSAGVVTQDVAWRGGGQRGAHCSWRVPRLGGGVVFARPLPVCPLAHGRLARTVLDKARKVTLTQKRKQENEEGH